MDQPLEEQPPVRPQIPSARPAPPRDFGPQPAPIILPAADIGQDPGMRLLLPVGRSVWAIAAGYLGLVSVLCLPAPFALFAGIMAIRDIRAHPERHGMGRAIFGIAMGAIGSLGFLFVVVGIMMDLRR